MPPLKKDLGQMQTPDRIGTRQGRDILKVDPALAQFIQTDKHLFHALDTRLLHHLQLTDQRAVLEIKTIAQDMDILALVFR